MNILGAIVVLCSIGAAAVVCWPVVGRTGLGPWHPAVAWLVLHATFFGLGSAALALGGRPGPAFFVAGAAVVFASAVAMSDKVAGRRAAGGSGGVSRPTYVVGHEDAAPVRPVVVAGLAGIGLILVLPTLVRVGVPFLVEDITGARSELAGPIVQVLRVTAPALALAVALQARGRLLHWLIVAAMVSLEITLASRYLAAEMLAILVIGVGLAGWRFRRMFVVAGALTAILAFGGIQVLRAYDQAAGRELSFAMERTINRVVLVQPRTLEAIQTIIPAERPYFDGLTWFRRLGPLVDQPDIPNLGYWIYPRLFPGQVLPGYAAPGLIGEAWANFGVLGLGLFGLLGVAAERLGAFISLRRAATGDLIAGAMVVAFLARTHAVGLNGLLVLIALVIGWRAVAADGLADTFATGRDVLRWRK